ncbi:MAG: hypothetical protein ACK4MS_10545 [Paracoccaceae bacterium]
MIRIALTMALLCTATTARATPYAIDDGKGGYTINPDCDASCRDYNETPDPKPPEQPTPPTRRNADRDPQSNGGKAYLCRAFWNGRAVIWSVNGATSGPVRPCPGYMHPAGTLWQNWQAQERAAAAKP